MNRQQGYQPVIAYDPRLPQQQNWSDEEDDEQDDGLHSMQQPQSYSSQVSTARSPVSLGARSSFNSHHSASDYSRVAQNSPTAFPLTQAHNPQVHRPPSYQSQHSSGGGGGGGRYNDGYGRQGPFQHGVAGVAPADLPVTTARGFGYQDNMYIEGNDKETRKCCKCCSGCSCSCGSGSCLKKTAIWTTATILTLGTLLFIGGWVIFPLVFMNSYGLQRSLIFMDIDQPENPEYTNYDKYNAVGVRNFYVNVTDMCCPGEDTKRSISLGVWQVVPENEKERSRTYSEEDYIYSLRHSSKPVIIYFHGQSGTRIFFYPTYEVLRKFFHVLAFDYRGYADSTDADITETNVVRDAVQLYEWLIQNTYQSNVYFWGHSLGTALATHTLKEIYRSPRHLQKPNGLVLEAPFTTMREQIGYHPIAKIWRWLAYFEQTFQDPVENNGFVFRTTENIKQIDCPVMVIHAEDDSMIPYHLGKKVYEIAYNNRTKLANGKALFKLVPAKLRCNHMEIYKDPQLPSYIREFLQLSPSSRALKPERSLL